MGDSASSGTDAAFPLPAGLVPSPPFPKDTPPNSLLPCWWGSLVEEPPILPLPRSSAAAISCLSLSETFQQLLLQGAEAGAGGGVLAGVAGLGGSCRQQGSGVFLAFACRSPQEPPAAEPRGVFQEELPVELGAGGGGTGPVLSPASQKFPMTPVPGVLFVRSRVLGSVGTWGLPQCNVGLSPVCAGVPQRQ